MWPYALLEGTGLAFLVLLAGRSPVYPLILFFLALYVSFRVEKVSHMRFFTGLAVGAGLGNLALLYAGSGLRIWEALDALAVVAAVWAAFHLFSWAHFFATYYRSPLAWLTTLAWATIGGLLIKYGGAGKVAVLLFLLLWLCFLPLWAPSWRTLHTLLFTAVYLTVQYPPAAGWVYVLAAFGFAFVPQLLGLLYPARKHPLDSLPVITPTLTFWQKLKAMRDVFFLLGDYYALVMEKYTWFCRVASLGRYLVFLGALGEILLPVVGLPAWLGWAAGLLALAGLVLELGMSNYVLVIPALGFYGAALAVGRGLLGGKIRYFPLVLGAAMVFLALALWVGRPRETRRELQRWKELSQ